MKKAVGVIITISMVMCSCMVAWGAPTGKIQTNGGTDAKDVYGSYKLSGTVDTNGDGIPDTDTKNNSDGSYTPDGDSNDKPDGDGIADTVPDFKDGDNNPYNNTPTDNNNYVNSDNYDDPDAVAPEGATFSVDISWGSLQYDYVVTGSTWDPTTHTYTGGTQGWKVKGTDNDADNITVTNHSNVSIRARYKFESALKNADNSPKLTGTFTDPSLKIEHAVGRTTAASDVTGLKLTGDPGTELNDNTKLGTVTIKIDYTIL